MLKVKILSHTPNPEEVIASAAKLCYSSVGVNEIMDKQDNESIQKFIKRLASIKHLSPFEHASFTFAIEGVSRSLTHQLVRHRIASYCVSKDTQIYTSSQRTHRKTIEELYNLKEQYKSTIKVRCVDENTHVLNYNTLKNIIYAGIKPVYGLHTKHGYFIKTTNEHRFLTKDGWKQLKDLKKGDFVYINGEALYKDKKWLKQKYNVDNLSQEEIGLLCGVSKHTIRSWVRKHGLQKELGSWSIGVEPHNKYKTKKNYKPLKVVSDKMMGNLNGRYATGEDHHSWKGDNITISGAYGRLKILKPKRNVCELCEFNGNTEIHHTDKNPFNNKNDNLIELCVACHKAIHKQETKKRIILSEVTSIDYIGEEETYDIEMPSPHHNFIANGFVVHNSQQSQRYVKENEFDYIIPPAIKNNKNAERIFIEQMESAQKAYDDLVIELMVDKLKKTKECPAWCSTDLQLKNPSALRLFLDLYRDKFKETYQKLEKEAIEDARYVFPNATETKIVVTMNARSLMHFFTLRCCNRAQWEIRQLADQMLKEVIQLAPAIFMNSGAPCTYGKCTEGAMSCGVVRTLENIVGKDIVNGIELSENLANEEI
jgi:flavin-dependent thymidylate synthase